MNSFPTLFVWTQFNVIHPSTLKYSTLHRLNCFVRAGVLFDCLSPCPVHIPSKSLFLSSRLIIIRSLNFCLICLSLSLSLSVSRLLWSFSFRALISKPSACVFLSQSEKRFYASIGQELFLKNLVLWDVTPCRNASSSPGNYSHYDRTSHTRRPEPSRLPT